MVATATKRAVVDKPVSYMGLKFDPASIERIAAELKRQRETKLDFVVPVHQVELTDDLRLVMPFESCFRVDGTSREGVPVTRWFGNVKGTKAQAAWHQAERFAASLDGSTIQPMQTPPAAALSERALVQLAQRMKISLDYVRYLEGYDLGLLVHNFRELIRKEADLDPDDQRCFMFRTLDGACRAVLSDSYRILDHETLFDHTVLKFKECGAQMWQARLWPDGFELFGADPTIASEVRLDRPDAMGFRWQEHEPDIHHPAVRVSNSETGDGGTSVSEADLRKICINFMVWGHLISKRHLGRVRGEGLYVSDETERHLIAAVWSEVRGAIDKCFDKEKFEERIDQLNHATQQELGVVEKKEKVSPEKCVEYLAGHFQLPDETRGQILQELLGSRDTTRYGLIQAVTSTAHQFGDDRGGTLERLGGRLLSMKDAQFARATTTPPPKKRSPDDAFSLAEVNEEALAV